MSAPDAPREPVGRADLEVFVGDLDEVLAVGRAWLAKLGPEGGRLTPYAGVDDALKLLHGVAGMERGRAEKSEAERDALVAEVHKLRDALANARSYIPRGPRVDESDLLADIDALLEERQ